MGKSAIVKSIIMACLGAIVILGFFFLLTRKPSGKDPEDYKLTAVDEITTTNLDKNYPADPRKVVELYERIMKTLYNETYSEDQETKMLDVLAGLMDEELLANQSNFHKSMSNEAKSRKNDGWTYSTSQVQTYEPDVITKDGRKVCNIECFVSLMQGKDRYNRYYIFVLRRDSENKWKILGWVENNQQ